MSARRRLGLLRAKASGLARLEVVVLEITRACDSACAACQCRTALPDELSAAAWIARAREAAALGAREVLISGGEPLLHDRLAAILDGCRGAGLRVTLHSNGLALAARAEEIAPRCDHLYLSLEGWDPDSYRRARGVDGWQALTDGIAAAKAVAPALPITVRVLVTRASLGKLAAQADAVAAMGGDHVSFLGADLDGGDTFGRTRPVRLERLVPTAAELPALRTEIARLPAAFPEAFVADSPAALDRIWLRYAAWRGEARPAPPRCVAPWTVAVIEPDGQLRPCFFLPLSGNARQGLAPVLQSPALRQLRRNLDMDSEAACLHCACWRG